MEKLERINWCESRGKVIYTLRYELMAVCMEGNETYDVVMGEWKWGEI